ncbi:UNVERIFIED_CONTAM: hypothetical protein FKN15_027735 [Acipenser sinensis]
MGGVWRSWREWEESGGNGRSLEKLEGMGGVWRSWKEWEESGEAGRNGRSLEKLEGVGGANCLIDCEYLSLSLSQLLVGDFGLSLDQSRSQMALWSVLAAPLFMSNDLRTLSPEAREILQNKLAIAINQDPLGVQGRRVLKLKSGIQVFLRPLSHSAISLVFLSRRTDMPFRYETSLRELNYTSGEYRVRERENYSCQHPSLWLRVLGHAGSCSSYSESSNPGERTLLHLLKELQLTASLAVGTSAGACWEL